MPIPTPAADREPGVIAVGAGIGALAVAPAPARQGPLDSVPAGQAPGDASGPLDNVWVSVGPPSSGLAAATVQLLYNQVSMRSPPHGRIPGRSRRVLSSTPIRRPADLNI
jgi:hypothetical protein